MNKHPERFVVRILIVLIRRTEWHRMYHTLVDAIACRGDEGTRTEAVFGEFEFVHFRLPRRIRVPVQVSGSVCRVSRGMDDICRAPYLCRAETFTVPARSLVRPFRSQRTVTLGRDMRQGGLRGCSDPRALVGPALEAFEVDWGFLYACRRRGGIGRAGEVAAATVDH